MTQPTETRWLVVAITVTVGVATAMQIGKVIVAIPTIRSELAIGMVTAGWIMSIFYANAAALGVTAGIVADKVGHRRTLLTGLGCMALASLAGAFAGGGATLLLARFLEGIGFVAAVIAAPSLLMSVTATRDRWAAIAWWGTYMPTGMALMILIAPPILAGAGWRGLWIANACVLGLCAVGLAWVTRGVPPPATPARSLKDLRITLSRPGPWLLSGCFGAYTAQFTGLASWLPTFLIEQTGRTTTAAAVVVAGVISVNIFGNLLGGWLLGRGAQRWVLLVISGGSMGLLGMGTYSDAVPDGMKLVLAAGFALIGGITPTVLLNGVPEHAPSPAQIGATNGTVAQGVNMGSLFAPPIFAAAVAAFGGWSPAGWLFVAAGGLVIAFALLLRIVERGYAQASIEPKTRVTG